MNRLLLVDGNSLAYRAYYATAYSKAGVLTNRDGIPVNAVHTLAKMMIKAINKYKPTHMCIAFDAGKKTLRHDKLESYKDGRAKTPNELIQQMAMIKDMFENMDIKHYEKPGIEADDIIGSLACKYASDETEVLILSSDKDMYQLVDSCISIIVPQNGTKEDLLINHTNFFEIHGYMPSQVPDIKGLVGDASDNLPGVVGIGPKGAVKLIQEYGTLEQIYANVENISGKQQERLIECKDMSLLCKEIATIMTDIEVPYSYDQLKVNNIYTDKVIKYFEGLYLNSLAKQFKSLKPKDEENQQSLFGNLVL